MQRPGRAAVLLAAALLAWPAAGQEPLTTGETVSPVLTLDPERLFEGSAWGRRAQAALEQASTALAAENRRIEAELTAEERALTERRAGMDPAAFRAEADAFDRKVVGIRAAQDAKERDLARQRDAERQAFFEAALPVLGEVMQERGAVVILDSRAIFLAATSVDATADLIARIDAAVGQGAAPRPAPADSEPADAPVPDGGTSGESPAEGTPPAP